MKRAIYIFLLCLTSIMPGDRDAKEPYTEIQIKEVYSKLIIRDTGDRVHAGQIKSEKGLSEFSQEYMLDMKISSVDFNKQMLVFGITDNISTRAYRFLKNKKIHAFCLDYYDKGIEYVLKPIEEGKKYSYVQVFLVNRIEKIPDVKVKNIVPNVLSKNYE